ncbi:TrmH family RNA methyltransferase [Muriicola marianensis]|uniref:rRNA methyltransferase n=1 Tax=Muriicola marianensis TaxID=1324801 RepID=A0ABQ1R686_9FLAO|nr:RNA methyltransferase [Muriicola marianensis]GGD57477.1 rRNA methyltransferase [Muriicola marianensis]
MQPPKKISSLQNPLVRQVTQLKHKNRERGKTGLFVLEGQRELSMALKGGYRIETILIYPEFFPLEEAKKFLTGRAEQAELIELSKDVYQKLAYREKTEGVLAIARTKDHSLNSLELPEDPLILIAEAVEKPGNLGALLRTADAAKLDAVIIADPKGDLYNPNTVRSSVGCLFTVPVATASSKEVLAFLRRRGIKVYSATLTRAIPYTSVDYTGGCAIAVGTESTGLSEIWTNQAEERVVIPMEGEIDSMNVSVSAAILIFEAKRQRLSSVG